MTANHDLREVVSWAVQLKLASEAAPFAQQCKPEAHLQRIDELGWTRAQFKRARDRAIAVGALGANAQIHIVR